MIRVYILSIQGTYIFFERFLSDFRLFVKVIIITPRVPFKPGKSRARFFFFVIGKRAGLVEYDAHYRFTCGRRQRNIIRFINIIEYRRRVLIGS